LSSSTRGRFKILSVSFNGVTVDLFDELFTVSVVSPEPPTLGSVSIEEQASSAGALVDTFADG